MGLSKKQKNKILEASWPGDGLPPENVFCFGWIPQARLTDNGVDGEVTEWKWLDLDEEPKLLRNRSLNQQRLEARDLFKSFQISELADTQYESGVYLVANLEKKRLRTIAKILGFNTMQRVPPHIGPPPEATEALLIYDLRAALPYFANIVVERNEIITKHFKANSYSDAILKPLGILEAALKMFIKKTSKLPSLSDDAEAKSDYYLDEWNADLPMLFLPEQGFCRGRNWYRHDTVGFSSFERDFANEFLDNDYLSSALAFLLGDNPATTIDADGKTVSLDPKGLISLAANMLARIEALGKFEKKQGAPFKDYQSYLVLEIFSIYQSFRGWWPEQYEEIERKNTIKDFIGVCFEAANEKLSSRAIEKLLERNIPDWFE